jgi:hypothetical protein
VVCLCRGVLVTGPDVFGHKEFIVMENLGLGCAGGQQVQNILDPQTITANAWAPATLSGFDSDSIEIAFAHSSKIEWMGCLVQLHISWS